MRLGTAAPAFVVLICCAAACAHGDKQTSSAGASAAAGAEAAVTLFAGCEQAHYPYGDYIECGDVFLVECGSRPGWCQMRVHVHSVYLFHDTDKPHEIIGASIDATPKRVAVNHDDVVFLLDKRRFHAFESDEVVAAFYHHPGVSSGDGPGGVACMARSGQEPRCEQLLAAYASGGMPELPRVERVAPAGSEQEQQVVREPILAGRTLEVAEGCAAAELGAYGGALECPGRALRWYHHKDLVTASQSLEVQLKGAAQLGAEVLERSARACTIDQVETSCVSLRLDLGGVPVNMLFGFTEVRGTAVSVWCEWGGASLKGQPPAPCSQALGVEETSEP